MHLIFPGHSAWDGSPPAVRWHLTGGEGRQLFEEDECLPCMAFMQSAALIFIMSQLQSAIRELLALVQTRTCEGRLDLFGPMVGRDCHSQWPAVLPLARAEVAEVKAASAAARAKIVFISKNPWLNVAKAHGEHRFTER